MKLLVVSNHSPENWSPEQKAEWERIEYIPFPNIPAWWNWDHLEREVVRFASIIENEFDTTWYVCVQGEFSFTVLLCNHLINRGFKLAFPTTERQAIEEVQFDGSVTKKSVFKFVKWRGHLLNNKGEI